MYKLLFLTLLISPVFLLGQNNELEWFEQRDALDENKPNIMLLHNKTVHRVESEYRIVRIDNFSRNSDFKFKLLRNKENSSPIKSYKVYGLSLFRNFEYVSEELVSYDSTFKAEFQNEFIFSLNKNEINQDGVGGKYRIRFDSLVIVNKYDSSHLLCNYQTTQFDFIFEIIVEQDPFVIKNGIPEFEVLVNDTPMIQGQNVQRSDKLELIIKYSDSVDLENSSFLVSSYCLKERGCFGGVVVTENENELVLPFYVPNDEFRIGYGGQFYIEIGELYRINKNGERYRVNLPRKNRIISYRRLR